MCLALAGHGCGEGPETPKYVRELAVFGYLYVGEAVSESNPIYLSRTQPIDQVYDFGRAAVTGALVTLTAAGGEPETLRALPTNGFYGDENIVIQEGTLYTLFIRTREGEEAWASTTTPTRLELVSGPPQLGTLDPAEIPERYPILFHCPDPDQILLLDTFCQENWEDARYINPIGPNEKVEDYDEYGGAAGPPRHLQIWFQARVLERAGPAWRIGWYGDMMVFWGGYQIYLMSIDDNYYNYLYRDRPETHGGIYGGIGVFGSAHRLYWVVRLG